jgi:hypothetical protein
MFLLLNSLLRSKNSKASNRSLTCYASNRPNRAGGRKLDAPRYVERVPEGAGGVKVGYRAEREKRYPEARLDRQLGNKTVDI